MDTNQQTYSIYSQKATKILDEISEFNNIPISKIRWSHFAKLLKEKYGVLISPYTKLTGKINSILAGLLLVDKDGSIISYNASSTQKKGRQHFTIVHEGVHFICDAQKGSVTQSFSDLIKNSNYSPSEQIQENNANFVASIVMCNDVALFDCLTHSVPIKELQNEFGMTVSALWTRIKNFLIFNCGFPVERSENIANSYCHGQTSERSNFLNTLLSHWESFKKYMYTETHFSASTFNTLYKKWGVQHNTASHFYQLQYLIDALYYDRGKQCPNCSTTFFGNKKCCSLCGHKLTSCDYIQKGDISMPSEVTINEQSVCITCPHCGIPNTDESLICQYCGAFVQNICTGVTPEHYKKLVLKSPSTWDTKDDWIHEFGRLETYGSLIPGNLIVQNVLPDQELQLLGDYPHAELHALSGYSRFCDQCGCVSSLFLQGLLPMVNSNGIITKKDDPFA